jgi:hypothetical protein
MGLEFVTQWKIGISLLSPTRCASHQVIEASAIKRSARGPVPEWVGIPLPEGRDNMVPRGPDVYIVREVLDHSPPACRCAGCWSEHGLLRIVLSVITMLGALMLLTPSTPDAHTEPWRGREVEGGREGYFRITGIMGQTFISATCSSDNIRYCLCSKQNQKDMLPCSRFVATTG